MMTVTTQTDRDGKARPAAAAMPRRPAAPTYVIEVDGKAGLTDAAGAALKSQIPAIGIPGVAEARVGTLYAIAGRLTLAQALTAARELLADPITQEFRLAGGGAPSRDGLGPHWRIEVWLKPTVTDPAEASVRKGLADLGLPEPESVSCGAVYRLSGRLNRAQAEKIAVRLLANPVIHRFSVAYC